MSSQSGKGQKKSDRLRSCDLCGNEISPYSPFCRNCGHPQGSMLALWVMVAILILMIAFYVGMTLFCMCNVQEYRVYDGNGSNPSPQQEIQMEQSGQNTPQEPSE